MSIGKQIKAARNRMGWNQEVLGDKIHMSRQTISHWETGRAPVPAEYISILEEALQYKFEIAQEQEETADEKAAEMPTQHEIPAVTEKKNYFHTLWRKNIPAWLCAAITGGVFIVS